MEPPTSEVQKLRQCGPGGGDPTVAKTPQELVTGKRADFAKLGFTASWRSWGCFLNTHFPYPSKTEDSQMPDVVSTWKQALHVWRSRKERPRINVVVEGYGEEPLGIFTPYLPKPLEMPASHGACEC